MNTFQHKIVVVTGAGGGIGRTIAITYAKQDAHVILVDQNTVGLHQTLHEIQAGGKIAYTYTVDVSQPNEIEALFQDIQEKFKRVDVLINNAGIGLFKSIYDVSVDEWDQVIHTNLRGTFVCSKEAAKLMRNNGGGSIVNISSTRALMSEPNSEAYAATKGGIVSLTHALAVSLGSDGITVNAISPGWIETGDYEKLTSLDHQQHPAMRVGKPEDIARACLYLTDPKNDFITGTNLVIDGGMTRKMIYEE